MNDDAGSGYEANERMDLARLADREIAEDDAEATSHGLAARLARGEASALTLVYEQHHVAVRSFAQRLVGDIEAAEDLVQDVFVALPGAVGRFRGECALRTFLVSIAVNHAKNHVRAAARRRAALARLALEPEPRSGDPQADLERKQLALDLMLALDELPLDQRVAIVLAEVEERTSAEIGAIVGAPEGTVRTRIFHAKRRLREILSKRSTRAGRDGGDGRGRR